jgi:carboxynorspermidine decarboxylase
MTLAHIKALLDDSPAWIINEVVLQEAFHTVQTLQTSSGCKILYSIKSMPFSSVLLSAKPYVTGFSVSSLFEARLARECASSTQEIHLTTPGIKAAELAELAELCTHINFNSLTHHALYAKQIEAKVAVGLRVNPKLSFLQDERYNPCRSFSKLGVDIEQLWQSPAIEQVSGLHFHTLFSAENYSPLLKTIATFTHTFHDQLKRLTWLNVGGGYLFNKISDQTPFINCVHDLQKHYALSVYSEPGNALVKQSGTLIATVIDLFNSDGKTIAVLDTSINHLPEVFVYQQSPHIF